MLKARLLERKLDEERVRAYPPAIMEGSDEFSLLEVPLRAALAVESSWLLKAGRLKPELGGLQEPGLDEERVRVCPLAMLEGLEGYAYDKADGEK